MSSIIPSSVNSPGYREPSPAEADHAIEQARSEWERIARMELAAGREIPVREIPREFASDAVITSAEAEGDLMRRAARRSFMIGIDLRAMEAARAMRQAAATGAIPLLGGAASQLAARAAGAAIADMLIASGELAQVEEPTPAPVPAAKTRRKRVRKDRAE